MKKQLLIGAMLMGAFFTANAQYTTSFESSEDFELGDVEGQNGWTGVTANITDEESTDGTYSLAIIGENGAHTNLLGAFSDLFEVEGDELTVSFDIMIDALDQSDVYVSPQSPSQELITSRIVFSYTGELVVLDLLDPEDPESLDYVVLEDVAYEAGVWYNFQMVINYEEGTIEYYLDDELIYTGAAYGATNIEQITFLHDNYASGAYIDNVEVTGGTAGTNNVLASKFSVFPNPATDVINIANAENILVNGVTIADINGRTVKSAQFAGVANASVNVSDLASGVYMMTVTSDKGTAVKKIVKN